MQEISASRDGIKAVEERIYKILSDESQDIVISIDGVTLLVRKDKPMERLTINETYIVRLDAEEL